MITRRKTARKTRHAMPKHHASTKRHMTHHGKTRGPMSAAHKKKISEGLKRWHRTHKKAGKGSWAYRSKRTAVNKAHKRARHHGKRQAYKKIA